MQKSMFIIAALNALVGSGSAWAHGGGLDANGCHTNRKTGDYHCHRSSTPSSIPPKSYAPTHGANVRPGGRAFANCAEARAAGAAPVRRGDPGYGPRLDRDNDGIGCEPYRGR